MVVFHWRRPSPRQRRGLLYAWDRQRLGIFDAFPDESGRQAHLAGPIAVALMAQASDLLEEPPAIEHADVLAATPPQ